MRKREAAWITHKKNSRIWRRLNHEKWDIRYTREWCPDCKTYKYIHLDSWHELVSLQCECLPF